MEKEEDFSDGLLNMMNGFLRLMLVLLSKLIISEGKPIIFYRKNSMAKKLHMGSSSNTDDPVVDDSNDRVYTEESGKKLYAIIRSSYCKSIFLVNLVNDFGRLGGFEKVYERISNPTGWAPIETVSSLISIVGGLGTILHRDFALEYIPKLKDAVWRNLLESPEGNIRNFTKDKIEAITGGFDILLKRVVSLPEKQEVTLGLRE